MLIYLLYIYIVYIYIYINIIVPYIIYCIYRENIVIKRAENLYPETSETGDIVGVVASYVHGKVCMTYICTNSMYIVW